MVEFEILICYMILLQSVVILPVLKDNDVDTNESRIENQNVPDKAWNIAKQVKNNNGAPPAGYKGGRVYRNIPLEEGDKNYQRELIIENMISIHILKELIEVKSGL